MAESQHRREILLRTAVLAVLAVLAGVLWWRWGLAGLAIACGIAVGGWLVVSAVVMPGRLAPPLREPDLRGVHDTQARLEAIDARTRLHHDLRNSPLQGLTVLAAFAAAVLGFQQLAEDRDRARQDRQLTRQGQASERFTRAIDQLASSRVETRIGGIYGLHQIAEQFPEENIGPVGEVLLAWLNNRPRPDSRPRTHLREHAPDVQAALTVLTGQPYASIVANRLNLQDLGLRGADLEGAYLGAADLRGTDLRHADLRRVYLGGADLEGADLLGADLESADLQGADLQGADLRDADLHSADLHSANLLGADLRGADLRRTDLRSAVLDSARLGDASLGDAELGDADLGGASLRGADLGNAKLGGASLLGADLGNADLRGASLRGANLRGTYLKGADLRDADLRDAESDRRTIWPDGFDWRTAGARFVP